MSGVPRKILWLALAAIGFWVLAWPLLSGFDGAASPSRAGHLLTLALWLAIVAVLCVGGLRGRARR